MTTCLNICIIPSDEDLCNVIDHSFALHGKTFSTISNINVNKVISGYSILYRDDVIKSMNMDILANNIIKLMMDNVPNEKIIFVINYLRKVKDEYGDVSDISDPFIFNKICELEQKFMNMKIGMFEYIRSNSIKDILYQDDYDEDEETDNDEDIDEEDDYVEKSISNFFESLGISSDDYYSDDEDDEEDESYDFLEKHMIDYDPNYRRKAKYKKKKYSGSKVLIKAKNAKRSYNRHGVLIVTDKEAKKRDEKIIKDFLKDFFPGDSNWIKDFRHDVLKRWMKMYCISKRNLKEFEKAHRKAENSKRNNDKTERTLEFTRRLFNNIPGDNWNNPNK